MSYKKYLRSNIVAEMTRKDFVQADVANGMDMAQTALSSRLRGKTPFRLHELLKLAQVLEIPLENLLNGIEKQFLADQDVQSVSCTETSFEVAS